jgi:hypothetical protein
VGRGSGPCQPHSPRYAATGPAHGAKPPATAQRSYRPEGGSLLLPRRQECPQPAPTGW